jgi:hypothetical protein
MVRVPVDDERSVKPAGSEFWHIWSVYIPRRSITGELVRGRVWRRHDGQRWIYKRLAAFDDPKGKSR